MPKVSSQVSTFQTRPEVDRNTLHLIKECAKRFSAIERALFADFSAGKKVTSLKQEYLKHHGITARHFNSIISQLEGKIAAKQELQNVEIAHLQDKISSLKKYVQKLEGKSRKDKHPNRLHQKKRLLKNLEHKLVNLQSDRTDQRIRLCFGSKRLFHAQFDLETNGYSNHQEWYTEWTASRNSSFFLIGSKDESAGNQSCTAIFEEDGTITLRIRLPACLVPSQKYIFIKNIYFKYGHQKFVEALQQCAHRKHLLAIKDPQAKNYGVPISYRFLLDQKGMRIFVTVPLESPCITTSSKNGVIGVDLNVNHLAIAETDRFGNYIAKKTIPLNTYGKKKNQAKAIISDVCADLVDLAKQKGKNLIIENLDFCKISKNQEAPVMHACFRVLPIKILKVVLNRVHLKKV